MYIYIMSQNLNEVKKKFYDIINSAKDKGIKNDLLKKLETHISDILENKNIIDEKKVKLINVLLEKNNLQSFVEAEIKLKKILDLIDKYKTNKSEGKIKLKVIKLI